MATQAGATKALICIPTYNERDNVLPLVEAIFNVVPPHTHLLFVDDGSPDGTGKLLDDLSAKNSRVHVLHRKGKLGLATAYIAAFRWGLEQRDLGFEWFFEMDADFSHDPGHLQQFFDCIEQVKPDGICGSRYVEGGGVSNWDRGRLMLSQMGSIYSRLWLSYPLHDWTGGFNAWSRSTLEALKLESLQSRGYAFQIELKYRTLVLGRKLVEIPIVFRERRAGKSKMSGSIVREAILGVAKLRWRNAGGELFL